MEPLKDFNVIFVHEDLTEVMMSDWEAKEIRGLKYYETNYSGLHISVLERANGELFLKAHNVTREKVTGYVGLSFPWEAPVDGYTVVPGIYYNGNHHDYIHDIPRMHLPESPVYQNPFCSASIPAVFAWDGKETAYHYSCSHNSLAGWNGVELNGEKETVTIYAPAREDHIYWWRGFDYARHPYSWRPGEIVSIRVNKKAFPAKSVSDVYEYIWEEGCRLPDYPAYNTPKRPTEEIVFKLRDWVYDKHCIYSEKGDPVIPVCVFDLDSEKSSGMSEDVTTSIGWSSGTMTAYPLLKFGGKYRDFAVEYVDFLTTNGISPSGVHYADYDGTAWVNKNHPSYREERDHCRNYGDHLYYLAKCITFEKENGHIHEAWEKDFWDGIDIVTELWEREHDFGMFWDPEGEKVQLIRRGTGAGSSILQALTEAARLKPEDEVIRKTLQEAADVYYKRCVLTGRCNAGPGDILEADDSESIAALTDALVQTYKLYGGEKYKEMAVRAGHIFASWVVCYAPNFPGGTAFEGINVCGGVIANVQNHHIGPGICVNSARFVYDLGQITGDKRWEEMYYRIRAAALNCVSMYDGEFCGTNFDETFAAGMVSEQINITDTLGGAGETWKVSACWPSSNILLAYWDDPKFL